MRPSPYPDPVADDHAPLSLFDRMPSRPNEVDMERAFALMRDRLSALAYSPSPRRNWSCGVQRRGWATWADPGR